MLISAVAELRRQGKEWRNLRLYGQELNYMTSAIARMNLFLHGIEDFHIARGDTLARPAFLDQGDRLRTFDVVLANPPYSIKQWNREPSRATPGAATSAAPRRRAAPTTPSSSTSRRSSSRRPAVRQSSSPTASSTDCPKRTYGRGWSSLASSRRL